MDSHFFASAVPAPALAATQITLALRGLVGALLLTGLAGCSHPTETAVATAPVAAPALVEAPIAPAPPAATPAPKAAAVVKEVPKPKLSKPVPVARPAAPAPNVAEAAPAAPAPEPVAAPAAPATRTQAGRVLDESGHPLVGATVMLRGSTKGTSTDATGSYTMEVPTGENTFVVGYGGYEDETASSRDGQPLTVTLLPSPKSRSRRR